MSGYYKTGLKISVKKVGDKYFMFLMHCLSNQKEKNIKGLIKVINLLDWR